MSGFDFCRRDAIHRVSVSRRTIILKMRSFFILFAVNISENNHEKLSIPAREKAPQAGYWYTTAKETSRQYFKQGDIFPDVESDWGDVYWYFDGEK